MGMIVYNPQKGRLETIDAEITDENTTWFKNYRKDQDIYMITDYKGGVIIKELGAAYPIWIYDVARSEIGHSQKKAKKFRDQYV